MRKQTVTFLLLFFIFMTLPACTATQPKNTNNICAIFNEKDDWYEYSKDSFLKWGVPIYIQMAFIHQESRFVADAQPPRPTVLGFIPWFRRSSAFGYPQAQDSTWEWYIDDSGNWGADRDDFEDAVDFVGWYGHISHKKLGISKWDVKKQYFAYHEGHGGFKRKTYLKKTWLIKVAKKVKARAQTFKQQLNACQADLESSLSFFW